MSALLPLNENIKELNVLNESGYTTRVFSKTINVCLAPDYESSLVLAHFSRVQLKNRKTNYRNHFTLFTNDTTLILVRAETTLLHKDQDAVLEYWTIEPSKKRMRTTCMQNSWLVSFDTIKFSNRKPESFATYTLMCHGEWWYFDKGICLNGVTAHEQGAVCDSVFIYIELHPKRIVPPLLRHSLPSQQQQPTQQQQPPPDRQPNVCPSFSMSSFKNQITPTVNTLVRPRIRNNDTQTAPKSKFKQILPSLYWFETRHNELETGNIDYFIPDE